MAGPSLIPGTTGTVQMGGTPGVGGRPGEELLQVMNAVQQIQAQKQQQAKGNLELMMGMIQMGFVPEEKEFNRVAQEAGLPIKQITAATMKPQDVTKMGSTLQPKQGAQSAFPVSDSAAAKAPGGGVNKTVPSGTGTVEQGVAANNEAAAAQQTPQSFFQTVVQRAREKNEMASTSERQKHELDKMVNQMKMDIVAGGDNPDPVKVGKLMAMGGIEFDLDQVTWSSMDPKQKQQYLGIKSGMESEAQKVQRQSQLAQGLWGSGRYATFQDAQDAAEGKDVKMLPNLPRLVDEAKLFNELTMAGLSPQQAKTAALQGANGGNLMDVLPSGVTPLVVQEMQMKKQLMDAQIKAANVSATQEEKRTHIAQLGLEVQLAEANARKAQAMKQTQEDAYTLMLKMQEFQDKNFTARFQAMIDAKRAGLVYDDSLEQNMINELAARSGMTPERVGLASQFLGMLPGVQDQGWPLISDAPYTFKPNMGGEQGLIDSSTGAPQTKVPNVKPPTQGPTQPGAAQSPGDMVPGLLELSRVQRKGFEQRMKD